MTTLSDTSTWPPLNELADGFDANKGPVSTALADRTITLVNANGSRVEHQFTGDEVRWDYFAAEGDPHGNERGADRYEAFEVDEQLYYVQFHTSTRPNDAVSLLLDLRSGHALSVVSQIGDTAPRVSQGFMPGVIDGVEVTGTAPAPTTSLLGRRVLWVYSEEHAYEHVYLSPHWYTWHCLAGPERGLADTDEHTTYQLRPGIHVFAWREKVIPCAAVTVADHRNARDIRSHGALFGLDESGSATTHFTFGAHGRLLSTTAHPAEYDPAR